MSAAPVPTSAGTPELVAGHLEDVLTLQQVAKKLHCSKPHVCHAIQGKLMGVTPLPAIQFGRRLLVRRGTLTAWLLRNETVLGYDQPESRAVNASERKAA